MRSKQSKAPVPYSGVENIIRRWTMAGSWHPNKNPHKWIIPYQILMILIFTGFFQFGLIANFVTIPDIFGNTGDVVSVSLTEMALSVKMFVIYWQRKKIIKLFILLDEVLVSDSYTHEEIQCFVKGIKRSKILHIVLLYGYIATAIAAAIGAAFMAENTLPIPSWFPLDWRGNNTIYWIYFWYQVPSMFVHCVIMSGIDAIPSCLLCIVAGYYDGLGLNLSQMGSRPAQDILVFKKSIIKLANMKRYKIFVINNKIIQTCVILLEFSLKLKKLSVDYSSFNLVLLHL